MAIFFGTAGGLQPLFGQNYGAKNEKELKFYFHAGVVINLVSSVLITILLFFVGDTVCALFGADTETLRCTVENMPYYSWGFILASLNTLISAYLYSTKRTKEALTLNVCRSFLCNTLVILALPAVFGASAVWLTFGVYETLTLGIAYALYRYSERNGVVFR